MRKKACRNCKLFVEGASCPNCGGTEFVLNWKGRLVVLDAGHSKIAAAANISHEGEYALKVQ